MSTLALTLTDFQQALPFSTKIEDYQLRPFIELSRTLDLVPLLGYAVLEAVDALPPSTLAPYAPGISFAAGQYVVRAERVYLAGAEVAVPPPPAGQVAAGWAYQPMRTLWSQHLKAYWLHASFGRFLPQHGLNLTKAGVTVPLDATNGTYTRPSAADRAALQAATDTTTEALRSKLLAFRAAEQRAFGQDATLGYDYGLTTTSCQAQPNAPSRGLRGINGSRRLTHYRF